ncbi:hypothetical protein C7212DRAFT_341755 [Tuber magnatum]|uniref:H-type lectin domain-containing protein n=1 Tax=Tuber magnatum TaxID=42249 RepID=A0A317SYE2_9PEZI|nr:hypothetical protein C7212DRAFT_341755 [Tuber magnatum]
MLDRVPYAHLLNRPQKETLKNINFADPFAVSPRLPLGLSSLDISKEANIRVVATITDTTKGSFRAGFDACGGLTLYSARASRIEVFTGHLELYQTGEFPTLDDHLWDKPQVETLGHMNFDSSPKVSGSDSNGLIHINAWAVSILCSAAAGWIAYPGDCWYVFRGVANTKDACLRKPQLKNRKNTDIGGARFRKPPSVFTAINSLDFGHQAGLRMKVEGTDVKPAKLDTWAAGAV